MYLRYQRDHSMISFPPSHVPLQERSHVTCKRHQVYSSRPNLVSTQEMLEMVFIRSFLFIIFYILADPNDFNPRMDVKEFKSPHFQRVYQYLKLSKKGENMDNFTFVPGNIDDDQRTCLTLLLRSVK